MYAHSQCLSVSGSVFMCFVFVFVVCTECGELCIEYIATVDRDVHCWMQSAAANFLEPHLLECTHSRTSQMPRQVKIKMDFQRTVLFRFGALARADETKKYILNEKSATKNYFGVMFGSKAVKCTCTSYRLIYRFRLMVMPFFFPFFLCCPSS